ncbi:hypothetical protein LTR37_011413 [Vermiconidia calcicola]|uniref:Uncharacterized protein n=1 Tax=Vermiconidia calcicola TaxID=1690605 RepID=A0ACC3N4V7_9PEZI|nr:hypothetical protein LTR37_011413 [Vermiconidia calcicola]
MEQHERTTDQDEPAIDQVEPTIEQHEQQASTRGARTEAPRSSLLELPPELRNRIYELVYEDVLAYIYLSASHNLVLTSRDQEGQSIGRSQRSMLHLTCQRRSVDVLFLTDNAPMSKFLEAGPWYHLRANHFRSLLDAFDWPVHLRNVKVITFYNSRYSDWGHYERERCPHSALLVLAVLKDHFPKIEKFQFTARFPSSKKTLHLRLDGREVQSWCTDELICSLPMEESPELWDLEQLSKGASQFAKQATRISKVH